MISHKPSSQKPPTPRLILPRPLGALGRNQSHGKPGRGPNMFYQQMNDVLPHATAPAPPLPRRLPATNASTFQIASRQTNKGARLPNPQRGAPYTIPPPRIQDNSRVFEFHRRQAQHYGADALDVSPTRPKPLGRTYSCPLPLAVNDHPILLRAAASLGDICLYRAELKQDDCKSRPLLKIQATLTSFQGDTPEQPKMTSLKSCCNLGSDPDSPHDTEPALTPGREYDLCYPPEKAGSAHPTLDREDPPYNFTPALMSDGNSKGMIDFLPKGTRLNGAFFKDIAPFNPENPRPSDLTLLLDLISQTADGITYKQFDEIFSVCMKCRRFCPKDKQTYHSCNGISPCVQFPEGAVLPGLDFVHALMAEGSKGLSKEEMAGVFIACEECETVLMTVYWLRHICRAELEIYRAAGMPGLT